MEYRVCTGFSVDVDSRCCCACTILLAKRSVHAVLNIWRDTILLHRRGRMDIRYKITFGTRHGLSIELPMYGGRPSWVINVSSPSFTRRLYLPLSQMHQYRIIRDSHQKIAFGFRGAGE